MGSILIGYAIIHYIKFIRGGQLLFKICGGSVIESSPKKDPIINNTSLRQGNGNINYLLTYK
jgi:hypothetical protein